MRRETWTLLNAAFATVLGILSVPLAGSTEAQAAPPLPVDQPFPPYNPYPPLPGSVPPTVLPPDLQSELFEGSTRSSNHLRSLFRRVASIDADADLCRQSANTCSKRI